MNMRSGFHFHHHETWFQKKTGLTLTGERIVGCFLGKQDLKLLFV
jgi:hypothetical protein